LTAAASLRVLALAVPASCALAQTAALPVREIENHSGILFYCKPLAGEAWMKDVCAEMTREMTSWAPRAQKPVVILREFDTPQQKSEQAKAAGFDPKLGLWILLTVEPDAQSGWGWDLVVRADGHAKPATPGGTPQTVTYSKRARTVSTGAVAQKGKELLGAVMTALTTPMRPL